MPRFPRWLHHRVPDPAATEVSLADWDNTKEDATALLTPLDHVERKASPDADEARQAIEARVASLAAAGSFDESNVDSLSVWIGRMTETWHHGIQQEAKVRGFVAASLVAVDRQKLTTEAVKCDDLLREISEQETLAGRLNEYKDDLAPNRGSISAPSVVPLLPDRLPKPKVDWRAKEPDGVEGDRGDDLYATPGLTTAQPDSTSTSRVTSMAHGGWLSVLAAIALIAGGFFDLSLSKAPLDRFLGGYDLQSWLAAGTCALLAVFGAFMFGVYFQQGHRRVGFAWLSGPVLVAVATFILRWTMTSTSVLGFTSSTSQTATTGSGSSSGPMAAVIALLIMLATATLAAGAGYNWAMNAAGRRKKKAAQGIGRVARLNEELAKHLWVLDQVPIEEARAHAHVDATRDELRDYARTEIVHVLGTPRATSALDQPTTPDVSEKDGDDGGEGERR